MYSFFQGTLIYNICSQCMIYDIYIYLFVITLDYAIRQAIEGREEELGFELSKRRNYRHPAIKLK